MSIRVSQRCQAKTAVPGNGWHRPALHTASCSTMWVRSQLHNRALAHLVQARQTRAPQLSGKNPPEEVGGHAVEEAGVARACRQAHVQLVQVVLALLGSGALHGEQDEGGRLATPVSPCWELCCKGQQASAARFACLLSVRCAQHQPSGAVGKKCMIASRQSAHSALTAPALPGRARPTWLSVQQGGLKDLWQKKRAQRRRGRVGAPQCVRRGRHGQQHGARQRLPSGCGCIQEPPSAAGHRAAPTQHIFRTWVL